MSEDYDGASKRYERYWRADDPPPLSDPLSEIRQRLLWERVGPFDRSGGRLLDAGCGSGDLLAQACEQGLRAVGMDLSRTALDRATSRGLDVVLREHSVEYLPWPVEEEAFDVVVSFEVIEHLLEPRALLEGARQALAPGGHLALSTPYHGLAKNLFIAGVHFDKHFHVEGDHIRFFSDRSLRALLRETGFESPEIVHLGRTWPIWENSLVWARRRP